VGLKLKTVELEGFRSYHEKSAVTFTDGVNVVLGRNGAGKTTLIEAIFFGLSGKTLRGKVEDLYNARSKKPIRVRVVMDSEWGELVVERERPNSSADRVTLAGKLQALGAKSVDSKLPELMGLGEYAEVSGGLPRVLKTAFVSQGELLEYAEMLSRDAKEKKEWVDAQLGLKDYDEAFRKLGEYSIKTKVEGRERAYKVTESDYKLLESDLKSVEGRAAELKKEAERLRAELEKARRELEGLRAERAKLEEEMAELRRALAELEEKKRKFEEISGSLKALREEAERKRELASKLEGELMELERRGANRELVAELPRIKQAFLRRGEVERALGTLAELRSLANEGLAVVSELEKRGEVEWRNARKRLEELSRVLHAIERAREDAETVREAVLREIREAWEALSRAAEAIGFRLPNQISYESLEEGFSRLQSAHAEALNSLSRVEAERELMEERLKSLASASGKCPVCGRLLTEDHKRRLIEETRQRLERLASMSAETKAKVQLLEGALRELGDKLSALKQTMKEVRRLEEEVARAREALGSEEDLRERVLLLERLCDVETKLEVLMRGEALELLEVPQPGLHPFDFGTLLGRVERALSALKEEYDAISIAIREAASRFAPLLGPLGAERLSRDDGTRLIEVAEALAEDYRRRESELIRVREDIKALGKRVAELEGLLREISFDEGAYRDLKKKLDEAHQKYAVLHGTVQGLEERVRHLETLLEEKRVEAEELAKNAEELQRAKRKLSVLLLTRILYSRDGIPSKLRSYALNKINEELNHLLQTFNLNFREVSLDEDLNITLKSGSLTLPFSQLSGGEKIVGALSFLLALRKTVEELLIGRRVFSFLILDEPTIHLDEERRASLVELLREFQGGRVIPQLIIVTHEEDLKESGDNVIYVENNGYTSVAKVAEVE